MADTENQNTQAAETKPERVKMPEQNGITRPKPGTEIAKVWETAEKLSEQFGRPATRQEVKEGVGDGMNPATFATQYARWTKFHGVGELIKKQRREAAEARKAEETKAAEKQAAKEAENKRKADEKAAAKAEKEAKREAEKEAKAAAKEAAKANSTGATAA